MRVGWNWPSRAITKHSPSIGVTRKPPSLDLANAIRPLAILKDDAGEVEDAKRLWEEARDLYAAADVREGVAESVARLARLSR